MVDEQDTVRGFESNGAAKDDEADTVPVGRTLLLLQLLKQKLHKLHELDRVVPTTQTPFSGCICVPFYLCTVNNTIIADGAGVIDFR